MRLISTAVKVFTFSKLDINRRQVPTHEQIKDAIERAQRELQDMVTAKRGATGANWQIVEDHQYNGFALVEAEWKGEWDLTLRAQAAIEDRP